MKPSSTSFPKSSASSADMGRRLQQLREEWAAAGEALDRNDRARARRRS